MRLIIKEIICRHINIEYPINVINRVFSEANQGDAGKYSRGNNIVCEWSSGSNCNTCKHLRASKCILGPYNRK